jgi:hypothetical protein
MVEDIIDGINHGMIYAPSLTFIYIYIYIYIYICSLKSCGIVAEKNENTERNERESSGELECVELSREEFSPPLCLYCFFE